MTGREECRGREAAGAKTTRFAAPLGRERLALDADDGGVGRKRDAVRERHHARAIEGERSVIRDEDAAAAIGVHGAIHVSSIGRR
jgi:hypothetical protein